MNFERLWDIYLMLRQFLCKDTAQLIMRAELFRVRILAKYNLL